MNKKKKTNKKFGKLKTLNNNLASHNKSKYLTIFNNSLAFLLVISCVLFVVSINDLSIKGFVLQELKINAGDLQSHNEKMELKIMNKESFNSVKLKAEELNMVKVDKIDYITVIDGAVAKN